MDGKIYFYPCRHLAWQIEPISETVYIFNLKNGEVYLFNGIEKDVWKMIFNKLSFDDMVNILIKKYEVGRLQLENDIRGFLAELVMEEVIHEI